MCVERRPAPEPVDNDRGPLEMTHPKTPVVNATASLRCYTGEYDAHAHHHAQVLVG